MSTFIEGFLKPHVCINLKYIFTSYYFIVVGQWSFYALLNEQCTSILSMLYLSLNYGKMSGNTKRVIKQINQFQIDVLLLGVGYKILILHSLWR